MSAAEGRGLIIDLFAGGGGASIGIEAALGRRVDLAINHDAVAMAVHRANHPETRHLEADIWEVKPSEATGGAPVDLLWASPDCTHFSIAKGNVPREQGIRSLAWVVIDWAREVRPRVIFLENVQEFLSSALLAAHHQILRYATEKGMLDTPRTTLVAAVVQAGAASWIHCGDSRLYMVRGGELLTRTRDHSYLELRNAPPPGLDRINRNVLFTCLGSPTKPVFSIAGPVALQQGDRIMLCSDGLWSTVAEKDIVHELGHKSVDVAVPDLVEKALRLGGDSGDNVTCIALEWETPDVLDSTRGSISTDTISDGVFASTVQSGWLDAPNDELDDAAIERSIAEINEAIRRSAVRKA